MMTRGAAVVMTGLLSTGLIVAIGKGNDPVTLNVGLHLITMGVVMVIAVGAPANHRMILGGQQQIEVRQDRTEATLDAAVKRQQDAAAKLDKMEAKLDEIAEYVSRLMNADRDEVADQRGHQH